MYRGKDLRPQVITIHTTIFILTKTMGYPAINQTQLNMYVFLEH